MDNKTILTLGIVAVIGVVGFMAFKAYMNAQNVGNVGFSVGGKSGGVSGNLNLGNLIGEIGSMFTPHNDQNA